MNDSINNKPFWETTAAVMIRCFWIGAILMFVYFMMIFLLGDTIYKFHSMIFEMTRQQFDVIHYCGMIFFKVVAIIPLVVFFSIKWVGRICE